MPRVIAITSEKGGVGKSTLAIHLAGAFRERGLEVLLADEDGRVGSAERWAERGARAGYVWPFPVIAAEHLRPKLVQGLDLLVIDTEGRPRRKDLRRLAERCDLILVPTGVSALELEAARALLDFFEEEGAARRVRVVLTRVPPVGQAAEGVREDLREDGWTVCNSVIRSYSAYQKAAEAGVLCCDVRDPRADAAWADIVSLSREVL